KSCSNRSLTVSTSTSARLIVGITTETPLAAGPEVLAPSLAVATVITLIPLALHAAPQGQRCPRPEQRETCPHRYPIHIRARHAGGRPVPAPRTTQVLQPAVPNDLGRPLHHPARPAIRRVHRPLHLEFLRPVCPGPVRQRPAPLGMPS